MSIYLDVMCYIDNCSESADVCSNTISQRIILCHRNQVQRTHISSYLDSYFVWSIWYNCLYSQQKILICYLGDIDSWNMNKQKNTNKYRHFYQVGDHYSIRKSMQQRFIDQGSPNISSCAVFYVYLHLFIRLLLLTVRLLAIRIDMIQPQASNVTSSSAIFMLNL